MSGAGRLSDCVPVPESPSSTTAMVTAPAPAAARIVANVVSLRRDRRTDGTTGVGWAMGRILRPPRDCGTGRGGASGAPPTARLRGGNSGLLPPLPPGYGRPRGDHGLPDPRPAGGARRRALARAGRREAARAARAAAAARERAGRDRPA